jgi:toxin YhaV
LLIPSFLDQLDKLIVAVERDRTKNPETYRSAANTKLLAALFKLLSETIPHDPSRPEYRQGDTLGESRKHWFRAKFGAQRFRLFFRYSSRLKIIVYVWVNDENTLWAYGARSDAYAVFAAMLDRGNPPDDWTALLAAAEKPAALERFVKAKDPRRAR